MTTATILGKDVKRVLVEKEGPIGWLRIRSSSPGWRPVSSPAPEAGEHSEEILAELGEKLSASSGEYQQLS